MTQSETLKQTALHAEHLKLGARMMGFAGYDMPVQYSGIVEEHMAVREKAGLFDVSHMGEFVVSGPHAESFLQNLVTNDVRSMSDGRAMYTTMCKPDGGIIDDLLVYRINNEHYFIVVNASNIEKDYNWAISNNPDKALIEDISDDIALIAIQGPASVGIVEKVYGKSLQDLKYYHFLVADPGSFCSCELAYLSRTGYTGELGMELYVDGRHAPQVWNALLDAGAESGLIPCGLGARDTLRLEAGYCLYGNDITEDTNPLEAGLGWVTKLKVDDDFIGKDALAEIRAARPDRKLVGFKLTERGIPRQGYPILDSSGTEIGIVTSGTQSPILECGIGLGYVPNDPVFTAVDSQIQIAIRKKTVPATIVKPPFHKEK